MCDYLPSHVLTLPCTYQSNTPQQAYGAAKALEARMKVGLTGTPIQNNLEELWALLSIVASTLAGEEATFKCVPLVALCCH